MDLGVKGYVLKENAAGEILAALEKAADGQTFVSSSVSFMDQRRSNRAHELLLSKPQINDLTASERRILKYIAEDRTSKEIAGLLHISVRTVENHRLNICQKLNLHGTHSLLKFAFANKAHSGDFAGMAAAAFAKFAGCLTLTGMARAVYPVVLIDPI